MKYSTGLANRALIGGCSFQAREREGSGREVSEHRQHGALGARERALGGGDREEGGLGPLSGGASVHHTRPDGILAALALVCPCARVHVRMRVCTRAWACAVLARTRVRRGE